jgi:hypothetical protein
MPFLVAQILERLKRYISEQKEHDFTDLPQGIKNGLLRYLKQGEEVLFTIRDFRAIYKAPRWLDSNTFFNSWFILTNQRIIIARNSSSFKRFRDIPLKTVKRVDYESGTLESRLTIHSPGEVDIIEFLRETREFCGDLGEKINGALESARKRGDIQGLDLILCIRCESRIPKGSKFCSECGVRLEG